MIDSFYFIALTTIDQSILIGGVVVCCRLVQPIVANETFSHAIFFLRSNKQSRKSPDDDFGSLVEIKGNEFESKLGSKSATSRGLGYFVTKKLLLCNS
jgi:hypothetical protein